MAIRIDLLPRYVGLKRWFKRIAALCALIVLLVAAGLGVVYYNEQLQLQTAKVNRENIERFAKQTEDAESKATAAESQAKPFQDTVNFFVDAGKTGAERAALLDLIHRYVYANSLVGSIDVSDGQNAKMTAMVQTPDDYARFLLNLRRGTVPTGVLFSDLPSGTGILGYPNKSATSTTGGGATPATAQPAAQIVGQIGTPSNISYYVFPNSITAAAKLREPVVIPAPPGDAAPAAPGAPGAPGPGGLPGAPNPPAP